MKRILIVEDEQDIQELLRAEPGAWIQINPIQEGALAHLVSVRKDAEHLEESVDSKGRAAGRDEPNQRKLYVESGFREQMDDLVELVQTARDQVNLWPRQKQAAGDRKKKEEDP